MAFTTTRNQESRVLQGIHTFRVMKPVLHRLSMLVLRGILVADLWVHGIMQPKQSLTDRFACTDHGSQDSNWHRANNSSYGSLYNK